MLELAPTVRTHHDVVRWIAIQTAYASCFVIPVTYMAISWRCGGDFNRMVSGSEALEFGLLLALVETLVFTPLVAIRSVSTLRDLNLARDELDRLAHTDALTGLLNRRGFDKRAASVADSPGAPRAPMAALLCDIDLFKKINDEFGHEFGDAALRHAAERLRAVVAEREGVVLGRQGGDEFVVLLPGYPKAAALDFAERLRQEFVARPVEWNGATAEVTISVGFAGTSSFDGRLSKLIASADAALYEAKRAGRNRVAVGRETLQAAA
jgi:diguanylate cyclase (GGDEF)-like protein